MTLYIFTYHTELISYVAGIMTYYYTRQSYLATFNATLARALRGKLRKYKLHAARYVSVCKIKKAAFLACKFEFYSL